MTSSAGHVCHTACAFLFFLAVKAAVEGPSFLFRLTQQMYMAGVGVLRVVGLREGWGHHHMLVFFRVARLIVR